MDFNQNNANDLNAAGSTPVQTNPNMTKKEFAKLPEMKSVRTAIIVCAGLCYFSAVVTLIVSVLLAGSYSALLDVVILTVLGIVIQLTYNFPATIVLTVYGVINVVVILLTTGTVGGWLMLVAGIDGIIYTSKLNKAYKEYQSSGSLSQGVN